MSIYQELPTTESVARQLWDAAITRKPCKPVREAIGTNDIEAAYEIQKLNIEKRLALGAKIVGRKIGLTSKSVQEQLGVDQPDFGILLNTMEVPCDAAIPWSQLMQPKVEAEVAFVMASGLNAPNLTIEEVMDAIDYATAAIEIVGSRIQNWDIKIADTIADNASSSHYVLGQAKVKLGHLDLINCQMKLFKNGEKVSEGTGAACLGSPLNSTLWLAQKLAQLGQPIQKGDIILTGALGPMSAVEPGDRYVASIEGLGAVTIGFGENI